MFSIHDLVSIWLAHAAWQPVCSFQTFVEPSALTVHSLPFTGYITGCSLHTRPYVVHLAHAKHNLALLNHLLMACAATS